MTDHTYVPPTGYLTMKQAQGRLGVSKATLQKRVKTGELSVFLDPRNKRVRLVREDDVDQLTRPIPMR